MPYFVRKTYPQAAENVAMMLRHCAAIGAASASHLDRGDYGNDVQNSVTSYSITAANGDGTVPTLLTLTKQLVGKMLQHAASLEAHKAADVALAVTVASVIDLATAQTALTAVKAWYNTHRVSTTYHYAADSTNITVAADATNQASADTLANELKVDFNAHIASGNIISVPRLISA